MADNILDIVQGISTAIANSQHGAIEPKQDGEIDDVKVKVGLKREKADEKNKPYLEKQLIDGFKVSYTNNGIVIHYQSDIRVCDADDKKFESKVANTIEDVASFIRKQYKKVTGNALTLTKQGDPDIIVQEVSKVRCTVQATQVYKFGGFSDAEDAPATAAERLEQGIKDFLSIGKNRYAEAKEPENATKKEKDEGSQFNKNKMKVKGV